MSLQWASLEAKGMGFGVPTTWVLIMALSCISCTILGNLFKNRWLCFFICEMKILTVLTAYVETKKIRLFKVVTGVKQVLNKC